MTQPYFTGEAHRSANKQWVLGCNDSDVSRGGHREAGNGRVVLVDHQADAVMLDLACLACSMDGAVSDGGTFIIHDAGFESALLAEALQAYELAWTMSPKIGVQRRATVLRKEVSVT